MNKKLTIITLITFILGIIGGFIIPSFFTEISFLGDIYVNLLKMMIVPVLFFGVVSALISGNPKETSKITGRTILIFVIMFLVSFLINCGFVGIVQPGVGYNFAASDWDGTLADASLKGFLTSIFPNNIIASMSTNTILPVILFAFIFGIAINHVENNNMLKGFFNSLSNAFNKMLSYIMFLTPIGVFALIGNTVANYGIAILKTAGIYVGMAWAGCAIIMILVMIVPVWIFCKINPFTYISKVYEIWIMTLSTCSSAATLPNTIRVCNEKLNIPKEITDIVVPLGCTIHMCGGAVSFSLLALFNMQMLGISMTASTFITMIVAALLINMGAPGIPGGGIVIGATYLTLLGIPLDFIGFYAGIYRLLDMPYTTMNVMGDITANCLVKKMTE